jgi:hypothetical protein
MKLIFQNNFFIFKIEAGEMEWGIGRRERERKR